MTSSTKNEAVTHSTGSAKPARESAARSILVRKSAIGPMEILFWIVAVATVFLVPSWYLLLNQIAILALFVLSIDLLLGYAGILTLGHAAFFGVGAYTAGLLAIHVTGAPVVGLFAAGATAGVLGFITSFLVLRGGELTQLMITLAVALMLHEAANQMRWLTGGADGLFGISMDPILGLFAFDLFGQTAYIYSLTILFILFLIARRLVNSPFGLSLRAIKDNPLRTTTVGVSSYRRLVAIYTIGAIYAGIAGALLAQTSQFVSLGVLSFQRSADALLVLILGGTGYLYGGLIGAVVFTAMHEFLSGITPQYWLFWIGLVLVIIVMVGHDRIFAGPRYVIAKARRLFFRVTGRGAE